MIYFTWLSKPDWVSLEVFLVSWRLAATLERFISLHRATTQPKSLREKESD